MAGSNQHYIPQFLQRGFGDPSTGKPGRPEQTWRYEKGDAPVLVEIEKNAAGHHFYSELGQDGDKTLDDRITGRESPLAGRVREFRGLADGARVDRGRAESIVHQLAPRTAHARQTFEYGVSSLLGDIKDRMSTNEFIRQAAGLDSDEPGEKFRQLVWPEFRSWPMWQMLRVPEEVCERLLFHYIIEEFDTIFANVGPDASDAMEALHALTPEMVRNGHNAALGTMLDTNTFGARLGKLDWQIRSAPAGGAILPDCVVIGLTDSDEAHPYLFAPESGFSHVLVPLSSDKILVGSLSGAQLVDLTLFNEWAARCSYEFFCASENNASLAAVATLVGSRAINAVEEAVKYAVADFQKNSAVAELPLSPPAKEEAVAAENEDPSLIPNFQISFINCANQETANTIAASISKIASEYGRRKSLRRLHGITFTYDVDTACAEFSGSDHRSRKGKLKNESRGGNTFMYSRIIEDGKVRCRLFLHYSYAENLLTENEEAVIQTVEMLFSGFNIAGVIEQLDENLSLSSNNPLDDQFKSDMLRIAYPGVEGYCNCMASGPLWNDEIFEHYRSRAVDSLNKARTEILEARVQYCADGDFTTFMDVIRDELNDVFRWLGRYVAVSAVLGRTLYEFGDELWNALAQWGLAKWLVRYATSLLRLEERRGNWSGASEFEPLLQHVERMLWGVGVFFTRSSEGEVLVHIPAMTFPIDMSAAT